MSNTTITVCEDVFVSGSDICGPGVRWGLYVQMALSLFVSLWPRIKQEVCIDFATSALVTGIALITTGFIQGERQEIAYYQQAIIVNMAGMGFGPAALAWLRRGHGRPDTVFFLFTIVYTIVMACYLFYTIGQESSTGPIINCFLDQVPAIYGKKGIKIINSVVVGVSIAVIVFSIAMSRFINRRYYNGLNNYEERPPIPKWVELFMLVTVLGAETALAISIEKTITEYSQFVSADSRAAVSAWQFGQIIPFFLLLQPVMEGLRAMVPKIELKHRARKAARQAGANGGEDGGNTSEDGKLSAEKSEDGGATEIDSKMGGTDVSKELV